ncbi:hypothetical protein BRAD285_3500 [Bradyrhizobium sp. ORS 285]|uniref:hypothetical protein n=1 Tax=Bradyrhizobium sp. ORS 285 TaxID=115808 RepID=UPI0002408956|nr:hypothetical protein [Bradyrhizobium sp. ORS 285]CCD85076.1 conserved hypothetical protein [Bradyrhizobium sp. ORS 285]SMX58482.1 hypothetical protein BRAD285_3500 [Bradyrhizobium sp. ORS 285]
MSGHPLLRAVTTWSGRQPTQVAFEALGFGLHRIWQDRVVQFCGEEQSNLVNRYWDETARETMQTLGKSAPDQRVFQIEPEYRSSFLDELFAARDFLEPDYPYPSLIKCLFHRFKRIWVDTAFREAEVAFFDEAHKAETDRFAVQTTGWTGRKREVIPFVDAFCKSLDFKALRKCWRKNIGDLVFEVSVDLGGNPSCITPPLKFKIYHADERDFVYDLQGGLALERLVPGFEEYARCRDAADYVLGVKAHIELFNVIADSFSSSPA